MLRSQEVIFTNLCKIRDGDKVVVMERLKQDWPGVAFPGGWCDMDCSAMDNTIKEVKEEAGLDVEAYRLVAILDKHKNQPSRSAH
ncbi:NUDIX domain-containing protein, partial [Streptococcus rupicaprae]